MKKGILVLLLVIFPLFTFSQNSLSTTGNVGIGTVNPKAKLEVSNGAFKIGNVENRNFTVKFPHDVSNQTIDVMFGNTYINGFLEIEITSHYEYQNSVGVVKKIFSVGGNPNGFVWNSTTSRIVEAEGEIAKNFTIGDFSWDVTKSSYKVSIHHFVKTGNTLFVNIKYSSGSSTPLLETTFITSPYTETIPLSYSYPQSVYFNGNVGIGTASPNATLQIGNSNDSGNPPVETEIKRLSLAPVAHSGSDWFFTTRDNNPYANLDIGYSSNKAITLRHDGNVGVGTTNPTSKLTVAGNINSREVKVSVDAGADFVFDKDYALPSLQEVEKFVTKNKHLPEIASAKEMQKEGINLSEMNIKLLQKIEELTLYVIEQEKKIQNHQDLIEKNNKTVNFQNKTLQNQQKVIEKLTERFNRLETK